VSPGRSSGILLHPTSLPGRFGIGDLGTEAHRFIDFLMLVAFNAGTEKASLSIQSDVLRIPGNASLDDELGVAPDAQARAGRLAVELPAQSAAVYTIAQ
jgi:hypothetical protein